MDDLVLVDRHDGVGRIRLNRPRAINAVNLELLRTVADAVAEFEDDPTVALIEFSGTGDRGLCAGADVRELREMALSGGDIHGYFTVEYRTDLLISSLATPYRSLMSGLTMGGGLGLAMHGSDRVVSASSQLAMPETLIGLFPDVFATFLLSRMPGEVGTHLALTGATVNGADAIRLGLADRADGPLPEPDPMLRAGWITECYQGDDITHIVGRLAEHTDPAARAAATTIGERSPLSVAVTLEALRRAAGHRTMAEQFDQELTLAVRLATGPDFVEGVRAQLVDRDRTPRWTHETVSQVSREEVLSYFVPLG